MKPIESEGLKEKNYTKMEACGFSSVTMKDEIDTLLLDKNFSNLIIRVYEGILEVYLPFNIESAKMNGEMK